MWRLRVEIACWRPLTWRRVIELIIVPVALAVFIEPQRAVRRYKVLHHARHIHAAAASTTFATVAATCVASVVSIVCTASTSASCLALATA